MRVKCFQGIRADQGRAMLCSVHHMLPFPLSTWGASICLGYKKQPKYMSSVFQ